MITPTTPTTPANKVEGPKVKLSAFVAERRLLRAVFQWSNAIPWTSKDAPDLSKYLKPEELSKPFEPIESRILDLSEARVLKVWEVWQAEGPMAALKTIYGR